MSTSSFNLRNVTPRTMTLLKKEAAKQKTSVNSLILCIIERGLGVPPQTRKTVYHDLDHLAGTWSANDKKTFDDRVKSFDRIDKELWE